MATGTTTKPSMSPNAAWCAAAPTADAVATGATLVYPVQVAPFPGVSLSPLVADDEGEPVSAVPEAELVVVAAAVVTREVAVAVAVAVLLAGTVPEIPEMPDIPDTLAVPATPATTVGDAQPHTGRGCQLEQD